MKQFKALIIKDLLVNRKGMLVPVWIVAGAYLLGLVGMIIAYSKGQTDVSISGIPVELLANPNVHQAVSFGLQVGMYLSFIGIIVAISNMILSTTLLNQDVKNKCELFHRSQPVNVWKLTASRFLAGIGGMVALSLALGLINFMVINVIVSVTTPLRLDWWLAINGFILSWLHMSIVLLVSGSMGYLLSAVFRDNAMGKGILGIAGIEIVIRALNGFYKTGLPSLVENLFKLIMSGLSQFQNAVTVMKYGSLSFYSPGTGTSSNISIGGAGHAANSFQMPVSFTGNLWATLFTWDIVFKLLLCVGLYALATYIYHKREVQF